MQLVAQTLHGYDHGHRLLAHGGDVDEAELAQLDRLSDLSGYVPLGTEFAQYYTGFSCGRYYAFACTWPDVRATRAGTVLTHTLLLPRQLLDVLHDPWVLQGHRRPESAQERDPYSTPLSIDVTRASQPAPSPTPERAAASVVLWFGQADRPALWTEEGGAEDVVRYLWSLLWGAAREEFSFCTFALQVRYLRRQPFGFLVLPSLAVGSFHDRARSAAWWQNGQLSDPILRERIGQPWARTIVEKHAEATHSMPRFCTDNGLPALDALAYPVFHRFAELESPATLRLAAARARVDLLERLWPNLDSLHSLVRETLGFVVQHQHDAPLAPQPFWDLIDLVKRSAIGSLVEADTEFNARLVATISTEAQRRILEADDMRGLGTLVGVAKVPAIREGIVQAVSKAFASMTDDASRTAKGCTVLVSSVAAQAPDLVWAVIHPLTSSNRVTIAVRALEEVPEDGQAKLADYVLNAAQKLDDVAIVIDVWCTLGKPLRALEDATTMVLAKAELRPELLKRILDRLDAEQRLAWALAVFDERVMPWAGKQGSLAATELRLSLSALIERCAGKTNAVHVLIAHFDGISMASVPDDDLFHPAIAAVLGGDGQGTTMTKRLADTLAPRLVRRVALGTWATPEALPWFALGALQNALTEASDFTLFSGYQSARSWDKDCLPNLAHVMAELTRKQTPTSLIWMTNVLVKPLQDAPTTSFSRTVDDLAILLATPSQVDGWSPLAARILLAIRRNRCRSAFVLVERIFPVLYPALVGGQLDAATVALLRSVVWGDWDIAKNWRHWLLEVWLGERWPAASFLRSLGEDVALFRRIAYRAWHKEKEKDFVKSLSGAWGRDDVLAARWRGPVTRFLANPDADKDYE